MGHFWAYNKMKKWDEKKLYKIESRISQSEVKARQYEASIVSAGWVVGGGGAIEKV